jgi:general secretion pathway protein D
LLGNLFRARKTEKLKTNLMIFIRPTILRDATETALETNAKYNLIREVQQGQQGTSIQLMPGQDRPILPPIEEYRRGNSAPQNNEEDGE